jgi:hypothetical protein
VPSTAEVAIEPPAPFTPVERAEVPGTAAAEPAVSAPTAEPEDSARPDDRGERAVGEARDQDVDGAETGGKEAQDVAVAETQLDPEAVAPTATGAEPDPAAPAEAPSITADPQMEVTVVPGVPRYHTADCILIRFMGENDLERTTLAAAAASGCTPCRACQPDQPESSPE